MNAAGIVCEYNPFHNGHRFHMDAARKIPGGDAAVIAVMSGNFVQRGDCAVFSKYARAKAAVLCGADLVLELPVPWALSSAENFARGGVWILERLGVVTHLSFGSECGDIDRLRAAARGSEESESRIREIMSTGISYAAAREQALSELDRGLGEILASPNNILAVEYLKALRRMGSKIEPVAVPRCEADHDSLTPSDNIASATYIRENLRDLPRYCPEAAVSVFSEELQAGRAPASLNNCERAVLGKLRTMEEADFDSVPYSGEGLANRLIKAVQESNSLIEIMENTKSKRYPMSRVRRLILSAWLGISKDDGSGPPPYIRVLAANGRGRELLREIKEKTYLPVITKPAAAKELDERASRIFSLEAKATSLWGLASPQIQSAVAEWKTSPFIC